MEAPKPADTPAPAPAAPAAAPEAAATPKRPAEDAVAPSPAAPSPAVAGAGAGDAAPPMKRARSSAADLSTYEGCSITYKRFVVSHINKLKNKLVSAIRDLTKEDDIRSAAMLEFEVKPDGFQSEFPMFVRFYKAGKADSGLRDLLPGVEFVIPPDAPKELETKLNDLAPENADGSPEVASKALIEVFYKLWDNLGMNQKLKVPQIYALVHDANEKFDIRSGGWVSADEEDEEDEDIGGPEEAGDEDHE